MNKTFEDKKSESIKTNGSKSVLARLLFCVMITCLILASVFAMVAIKPTNAQATEVKPEVWDGSTAKSFAGGDGTKDNPYLISNGAQLAYLSYKVNAEKDGIPYETYIKQTADIVLNDITISDSKPGLAKFTDGIKTIYIGTGLNGYAMGYWYANADGSIPTDPTMPMNPQPRFNGNTLTVCTHKCDAACRVKCEEYCNKIYCAEGCTHAGQHSTYCTEKIIKLNQWWVIGVDVAGIAKPFKGRFDGGGYSISGVFANDTWINRDNQGLFGKVGELWISEEIKPSIKNTNVINSYIKGRHGVGAIAGNTVTATIENCSSSAIIASVFHDVEYRQGGAGGIVGKSKYTTITNCISTSTVIGKERVGGIVGELWESSVTNSRNRGTITGNYGVGGVVGVQDSSPLGELEGTFRAEVTGSNNSGTITGLAGVGGIVGKSWAGTNFKSVANAKIENCTNTGSVSGDTDVNSWGYIGVGGIVGYNTSNVSAATYSASWGTLYNGSSGYALIINCTNLGSVTGKARVGGIAGFNFAYLDSADAKSKSKSVAKIINSYNMGKVSGETVGGIVGENKSEILLPRNIKENYNVESMAYIENSFNTANVIGSKSAGGLVAYNNSSAEIGKSTSLLENCYNSGKVSLSSSNPQIGGIIGYNEVLKSNANSIAQNTVLHTYYLKSTYIGIGTQGDASEDISGQTTAFSGTKVTADIIFDGVTYQGIKVELSNILNAWVQLNQPKEPTYNLWYLEPPYDYPMLENDVTETDTVYTLAFNYANGYNNNENLATKYYVASSVYVAEGMFTRPNYTLTSYNTAADGTGTNYEIGSKINDGGSLTLYAQWSKNIIDKSEVIGGVDATEIFKNSNIEMPVSTTMLTDTITYSLNNEGDFSENFPTCFNVGTYIIKFKITREYYVGFEGSFTLTITKATVTAPTDADAGSKTYTGSILKSDIQANGYTVTTNTGGTNAGTYPVIVTLTDSANYKWADGTESAARTLNFIIEKATVTAPTDADAGSKTYTGSTLISDIQANGYTVTTNLGGISHGTYDVVVTLSDSANHKWADGTESDTITLNFTISLAENSFKTPLSINGWVFGSTANAPTSEAMFGTVVYLYSGSLSGTYTTTVPTNAGTYWVKAIVEATSDYTGLVSAPVKFTIAKATVTAPTNTNAASKTYTGSTLTSDIQSANGYTITTNAGGINAGTYPVVVTLTDSINYKWTDADTASITLMFTITSATNSFKTNLSINGWEFGSTANAPISEAMFGTVTYTYSSTVNGEYTTTVPTNAGKYWVKAKVEATNDYTGLVSEPVGFLITKAENSFTTNLSITNWTFNQKANAPTSATKFGTVTYTYSSTENGEYTTTVPTNAGKYWVKAMVEDTNNYIGLVSVPMEFSITKTRNSFTTQLGINGWVFGSTANMPTIAATSGTVTYTYSSTEDGTYTTTVPTKAGTYWVKANVKAADYTDLVSEPVEFTITKATNSFTTQLSINGWAFGSTVNVPTSATKFGKVVYIYSYSLSGTYTTTIPTNVGTYWVKAIVEGTDDYTDFISEPVEFTITKATNSFKTPLSINGWVFGSTANAPTSEAMFGTVTYTYSSTENGEYTTTVPTNAGTYWVKATVEGTDNYASLEGKQSFEITAIENIPQIPEKGCNSSMLGTTTAAAVMLVMLVAISFVCLKRKNIK